jgi:hypothetical protein
MIPVLLMAYPAMARMGFYENGKSVSFLFVDTKVIREIIQFILVNVKKVHRNQPAKRKRIFLICRPVAI